MFAKSLAIAAAAAVAASPCIAAAPQWQFDSGERRSGATAGGYFAVPFGGPRSGRAQAGLRLQTTHDYRSTSAPNGRIVTAEPLELRLIGEERPTLFVADVPVTGRNARQNIAGGGIITVAVLALAVVGAVVIWNEIDDDEDR
ncbi:MAG: hypothetical protein M3N07_02565 [Pseudomonadota bacterium]|nr:hypothetical protein [Pseudomonadota bacterium]